MHETFRDIWYKWSGAASEALAFAKPKMQLFGLLAAVGYPLYYVVWVYLFPQPYENFHLRVCCAAVGIPLLLTPYWPRRLQPFLPVYWYVGLILCLPTFFTYMALHNGYNIAWASSTVSAFLLLMLVMDSVNALIMAIIGTAVGLVSFGLTVSTPIPWDAYLLQIPLQLFALGAGAVFNLANERERRAKLTASTAMGGQIAHELATPFQTIRLGAHTTRDLMPALRETRTRAERAGLDVPLSAEDLEMMDMIANRANREVEFALTLINMMLTKAGSKDFGDEHMTRFESMDCVRAAIDRFMFKSEVERSWVKVETSADFHLRAVPLLFEHVIFNLLKNSLDAVRSARRRHAGEIRIWAEPGARYNELHFRDNGTGISKEVAARIFDPFFTTSRRGTGLGLHFCRRVMRRFDGEIRGRSEDGVYTEFILRFPRDPCDDTQYCADGRHTADTKSEPGIRNPGRAHGRGAPARKVARRARTSHH